MKSYYVATEDKLEQLGYVKSIIETKSGIANLNVLIEDDGLVVLFDKKDILALVKFLKENIRCLFHQLVDITAVDYPEKENRFELVYLLLSLEHNIRLKLKTNVKEDDIIDSVTYYYINADWLEREVWDMFGVYFKDHPDLRRLLTDYGFDGHPLRKDFPLTGFMEVAYDEAAQKVVYKPLELAQGYRDFSSQNVWIEGSQNQAWNNIKNDDKK
jgi:NADH-quinone oxidoreductase subunit C